MIKQIETTENNVSYKMPNNLLWLNTKIFVPLRIMSHFSFIKLMRTTLSSKKKVYRVKMMTLNSGENWRDFRYKKIFWYYLCNTFNINSHIADNIFFYVCKCEKSIKINYQAQVFGSFFFSWCIDFLLELFYFRLHR